MKARHGFVSNSSSSSFMLDIPDILNRLEIDISLERRYSHWNQTEPKCLRVTLKYKEGCYSNEISSAYVDISELADELKKEEKND